MKIKELIETLTKAQDILGPDSECWIDVYETLCLDSDGKYFIDFEHESATILP